MCLIGCSRRIEIDLNKLIYYKKMKKVLFYTAALVMALCVASCGNKKEAKDGTVKETTKKESVSERD